MVARTFARFGLGLAAVCAGALLWSRVGYVPVWDGRIYADCVIRAASEPFALGALRCASHPSHAYVAVLSLVQRLEPGSYPLLLATNAALLVLAAFALARILRRTVPGDEAAPDRLLAVAAFVVQPVVLANVVQPGLDLGATVFFLCAVAAAVERRPWVMAAFGLLAAFSKESGALLYGVLAGVYALAYFLPRPWPRRLVLTAAAALLGLIVGATVNSGSPRRGLALGLVLAAVAVALARPRPWPAGWRPRALAAHLRPALGSVVPLVLPMAAFVGYLAYRALLPHEAVLWSDGSGQSNSPLATLLVVHLDRVLLSYLALALVLGFLWLPAAPLVTDAAIGAWRAARGLPPRPVPAADPATVGFLVALTGGGLFVLTRYVTFSNPRYLLPLYPLFLALLVPTLLRLRVPAAARRGGLALLAALFAGSAVRTVDPVSRALWGTFAIGRHELLRITAITGECCGYGRDQLTYNLQFTAVDALGQAVLGELQPVARRRALILDPRADWYTVGRLDARSRRTLLPAVRGDTASGTLLAARERTAPLPDSVWYLAFPNIRHEGALGVLARTHAPLAPDTSWVDGYAMAVWPFVRRDAAGARVSGVAARIGGTAATP